MGSVSEAITGAVSASPRPRLRDWLLGSAAPRRTRERSDPPVTKCYAIIHSFTGIKQENSNGQIHSGKVI